MTHLGLFEGIGGFSLAARWMGWQTLAWCEWNEFGQKVLRHHFPEAEGFGDIAKTDFTKYAKRIDVLTGGFPCQPYSVAGKRKGTDDDRHLWPEMLRAIREIQPSYVVGENVRGLTNWNEGVVFDQVQADLEAEGYEVLPFLLPACAVNAPHRRDRIWFIAYSDRNRKVLQKRNGNCNDEKWNSEENVQERESFELGVEFTSGEDITADTNKLGQERRREQQLTTQSNEFSEQRHKDVADYASAGLEGGERTTINPEHNRGSIQEWDKEWAAVASEFCRVDDGVPERLDGISLPKWRNESIKAYGNAIVPQVAFQIFKAIELYETQHQ